MPVRADMRGSVEGESANGNRYFHPIAFAGLAALLLIHSRLMNTAPYPAPVPPPPSPPKQGIPAIGWVGIGCGSLRVIGIVLAVIAFGFIKKKVEGYVKHPEKIAAEMIVGMHPDLEIIHQNDEKGAMTIKVKGGETLIARYDEIVEGKFSYKDAQGNVVRLGGESDLSNVPSWVPKAPDHKGTQAVQTITNGKATGFYSGTSTETPENLILFFNTEASKQSLPETSSNTMSLGKRHLTHTFSDSTREIVLSVTEVDETRTHVNVSYREK
jgi:hypothetical protein